ncbi:MAG TPA: hypothetical protein VES73_04155, partial [Lamprocystis sp. (in: g-proteobacteria)]|nr:hypothetical protein [Lamprocystis sp. (in: g-proteobacteria)]
VCYVLALAEGGVRLIEVPAGLPAQEIKVDGMPRDAASHAGRASIADRSYRRRLGGGEGQKVLIRQYARAVDAAVRSLLAGSAVPLVLAAPELIAAIYRSVNTYPHLATQGIRGNPEKQTDAELAAAARGILDDLYRDQIVQWTALFDQRANEGRASTDIAQVARAATFSAVQSLLVDMDGIVHGTVDETDGTVAFAEGPGADSYGVVDEIARRVLMSGGQVLSVRQADIPEGQPLAAILRYPL